MTPSTTDLGEGALNMAPRTTERSAGGDLMTRCASGSKAEGTRVKRRRGGTPFPAPQTTTVGTWRGIGPMRSDVVRVVCLGLVLVSVFLGIPTTHGADIKSTALRSKSTAKSRVV